MPVEEQPEEAVGLVETIINAIGTAPDVWSSGGWVMIPLALLSLFIYLQAALLILFLARTRVSKISNTMIASWIRNPGASQGHGGEVINWVCGAGQNADHIRNRVEEVRLQIIPPVNSRITMLSNLVSTAPLMGLLGTVIGMLNTFKGLASTAGQTVDLVASGISEALITTQTGLMVAIPGYIMLSVVIRRRAEYAAFLTKVENFALQSLKDGEKQAA